MGPCLPDHISCLSQRKPRWTMSMHLLGFEILYFGNLDLDGPFAIFSLVWTKVIPGGVQQPIGALRSPWDNFMVQCKPPLSSTAQ